MRPFMRWKGPTERALKNRIAVGEILHGVSSLIGPWNLVDSTPMATHWRLSSLVFSCRFQALSALGLGICHSQGLVGILDVDYEPRI